MKRLLLLLLSWASVLAPLRAQEGIYFGQRLLLHYNQWQGNQGSAEDTRGTYDFNLGLPVLTYRLGALALTGDVNYEHAHAEGQSRTTLGLDRYGARVTLFPYRPFHLSLDFNRTQSPAVAGQDRAVGTTFGVGLNYRGRRVQDFEVTLQRGILSDGPAHAGWSIWQVTARQFVHSTDVSVQAARSEFKDTGVGSNWHSTDVYASTRTALSQAWALRSNLQMQDGQDSRSVSGDLNLTGTQRGWTSLTDLSLDRSRTAQIGNQSQAASQSLAMTWKRGSVFSSAALNVAQGSDGLPDRRQGVLLLGGSFSLGRGWQIAADAGRAFSGTPSDPNASAPGSASSAPQNLRTLHVGLSQGGDLPGLLRQALFFLSDRSFQQRISEEYPPGYVPSELAAELARRRFRQMGNFSFTSDLWHEQADSGAHSDWTRVSGQIRVNNGLTFTLIGDWKTDLGLSLPGQRMTGRDYTFSGAYSFGLSQVVANAGYSRNAQTSLGGSDPSSEPLPTAPFSGRYLSTSFNSRFWLIPYGFQWIRYESSAQPTGRAFTGYFLLNFRQVNLRVNYQTTRRADGLRDTRITVDLLRWMNTVSLGGGWS